MAHKRISNFLRYDIILQGNNLAIADGYLGLCSVTLVHTDEGPLLFDTGHFGTRPGLVRNLGLRGVKPEDIKFVFLSHLHFDHVNNMDLFPRAKVFVSALEKEYAVRPHPDDPCVPWMLQEQMAKHDVTVLRDPTGELFPGIQFHHMPGHTPGSYVLSLDTPDRGRVVLAGDALKYPKELLARQSDMVFDSVQNSTISINKIAVMADRIVPGHFLEMVKDENLVFTWDNYANFTLLIR